MKAKIAKTSIERFKELLSEPEEAKKIYEEMRDFFYGRFNEDSVRKIKNAFEDMVRVAFGEYRLSDHVESGIKVFEMLVTYCERRGLTFAVDAYEAPYLVVRFSGRKFFLLEEYAELIEEPDYENLTLAEIQGDLEPGMVVNTLPQEMRFLVPHVTIRTIKEEKSAIETKQAELDKLKDDLKWYRHSELAELQKEIQALQNKLSDRKRELLAELDSKMEELECQKAKLEKEIFMLESQIYTIRSYSGETVELNVVRNGKPAPIETPIVLNQKIVYLDEDLSRMTGIYQSEIHDHYKSMEDVLKYRDDVVEAFCPQQRAITFFRLTRNSRYIKWNSVLDLYQVEELIHGQKMGFILRNGEQLLLGWLDEEWGNERYVTFHDNLMYRPGENYYSSDDKDTHNTGDTPNSMLSRMFALSVLQGILDEGRLIAFPERINVMNPGKYVIFNFADAWLMDDRFGDFSHLVSFLNEFTREKDKILLFLNIKYADKRSNGERCMTRDCELRDGVHTLNLVKDDGSTYVSAKKKWSRTATANVEVYSDEYINITYMNSVWLKYYVQTKKLGDYSRDYARMLPHFKKALEIIINRETEEMALIQKYYKDADKINDWQVKLSHWKLKNQIRVITEFQAKRVAAYLKSGKYDELKNIFTNRINIEYPLNDFLPDYLYGCQNSIYTGGKGKYSYGSEYYHSRDRFYWRNKEEFEKKKDELLKSLKEKEEQEEEKLQMIRVCVADFIKKYQLDISKIIKNLKANEYLQYILDFTAKDLPFRTKDALSDDFIACVKNGNFNHIRYDKDYSCNTEFWYLYYLEGLHHYYISIMSEARELAYKNWLFEVSYEGKAVCK